MARTWIRRPHVPVLIGAAVLLVAGVVLLISPLDGLFGALAWVLIVAAIALGVLTLFFSRAPKS
ncbi:hypothetical protein ASG04_10520 [Curtobacterium sp. Leaf183]|uniref:hypothetical protein n=1 Tax=Curtobacterium sp. Leaf183 TaxID=1736291 RepID=UPI0006FD1305|nr:hypothetical protein [Curtobacterium sp. Leaf183]KQS09282.1 hypothetical protein ASG04_10520 [Curtobacterium sp. Leaf183]